MLYSVWNLDVTASQQPASANYTYNKEFNSLDINSRYFPTEAKALKSVDTKAQNVDV